MAQSHLHSYLQGKKLTLLFVLFGGGLFLIGFGVHSYFKTRKLTAEGKTANATVVSHFTQKLYEDHDSYHLTVAFPTTTGEWITNQVMVKKPLFDSQRDGTAVNVFYLPGDPSVCFIGNRLEARTEAIYLGSGFVTLGAVALWFFLRHPRIGELGEPTLDEVAGKVRPKAAQLAKESTAKLQALLVPQFEYATADPKNFPHLDLEFYDVMRRFLESRGFRFLEDSENVTLRNSPHNPNLFTRNLLSSDGTIIAGLYHMKVTWKQRLLAGARECRILDLTTRFANGCFVCTTNAQLAAKIDSPPEIDRLALGYDTPLTRLLELHEQRIKQFASRKSAQPVTLNGVADIRQAWNDAQRIRSEFRHRRGFTSDELRRIGNIRANDPIGDRATSLLAEELEKERNRERK